MATSRASINISQFKSSGSVKGITCRFNHSARLIMRRRFRVMASSKANLSVRGRLRNTWKFTGSRRLTWTMLCGGFTSFLDKKCFQPAPVSVSSSRKGTVGTIRRFKGRLLLNTPEELQTVDTFVLSKRPYSFTVRFAINSSQNSKYFLRNS